MKGLDLNLKPQQSYEPFRKKKKKEKKKNVTIQIDF